MDDAVPWQLRWNDDGTAASIRNPGTWYQVRRLGALGELEDREVESISPEGSIYIGIYPNEEKARAAAEYFELTRQLAPPTPPQPPPGAGRKIAVYVLVAYLAIIVASIVASLIR